MSSKPVFINGSATEGHPADSRQSDHVPVISYARLLVGPDAHILDAWFGSDSPLGLSSKTVADQPVTAFMHVDDQPVFLRLIADSAANPGFPLHAQVRFGNEDRHTWVLAVVTRKKAEPNGEFELQLVSTRIPSDEIAELVRRESRWNYALVGSELGVWDHNFRTGELYYSDIWKQMRGIPLDEEIDATFDTWIKTIHPEDQERTSIAVAAQSAGDERYQVFQYRELHRDGHYIWVECRGSVVEWDREGKPLRVVGTDIDITRRKNDEAEMERLSRRLELALEVSQIGVFEADLDRGYAEWDENIKKIFGLQGTETQKPFSAWEDMIVPEDRERAISTADQSIGNEQSFRNEYRIRRPDGAIRYVRARAAPFLTKDGGKHVIGANWDVTDDVLLRQELAMAKELAEARNRELEEVHARIRYNALHDYLTGLPNRRYLEEFLERETTLGVNDKRPLCVLHIDLDRFKQINDTLGHEAGDVILNEAAKLLRGVMRGNDFVARIGGDEFAFVSREMSTPRRIAALADRIIRELSKPIPYKGHFIRTGASIGIARADDAEVAGKQLLLNADIALYRAKNRGRNRQEFFSLETQNEIIHTKRLSDEILSALENGEFIPYYQPQFNADDLSIAGIETLVRWKHPQRGIIPPDQFLPVAADLDVVSAIDGLVLEKALVDFHLWEEQNLGVNRISVNVSARRLDDPQLIRKLKALKFKPGTVAFELLESIFLDDSDENTVKTLSEIRELGIEIEIDDFGTGHASIVSLMKIAPNILKIDRELVRTLPHSDEQRRLIASIVEIGKSLNIRVLAEGVETRAHVIALQQVGCDILQGYGLARPMPAADIPGFLRSKRWLDA